MEDGGCSAQSAVPMDIGNYTAALPHSMGRGAEFSLS